jgi:hypothetical protein
MILYVNGDSHTAAAEAVNPHAFAEDDTTLFYMGRAPHPDNLAVSWGKLLAKSIKAGLHCGAESASSNARILRTTRQWLSSMPAYDQILLIIQWSTWEREEWLYKQTYLQVGASGLDHVPEDLQNRYREYVASINWSEKTTQAHEDIWQFHQELKEQGIKHVFFNGNNDFSQIQDRRDWGVNYIGAYDPAQTYDALIRAQGIDTVAPNSWHFGRNGHSYFHRFMLQYIIDNKFI